MNGDISIVKPHGLSILNKREVVAVNTCRDASGKLDMPVLTLDVDNIHIITFFVEERIQSLCRAQRYVVLRRVATTNDGNVTFQLFHYFCFFLRYVVMSLCRNVGISKCRNIEISKCRYVEMSLLRIYFRHFSMSAAMSSANSLVKSICS